jgi:hypothetical protein
MLGAGLRESKSPLFTRGAQGPQFDYVRPTSRGSPRRHGQRIVTDTQGHFVKTAASASSAALRENEVTGHLTSAMIRLAGTPYTTRPSAV